MTRGVAGTACLPGMDMLQEKGGRAGCVNTPANNRVKVYNGMGQRAEWRCLSLLDSRAVSVPEGERSAVVCWRWERSATVATESSLKIGDAVEREDSTAWLASWVICFLVALLLCCVAASTTAVLLVLVGRIGEAETGQVWRRVTQGFAGTRKTRQEVSTARNWSLCTRQADA